MSISASQFGDDSALEQRYIDTPLSLSTATNTSTGVATAWRNKDLGKGKPMAYSKRTQGSAYQFDDTGSEVKLPESDKGASFGGK